MVAPLCVDQRGLVARTEDLMTPVIVYSSWREGVDGPVDAYPAPVVDYNDRPAREASCPRVSPLKAWRRPAPAR